MIVGQDHHILIGRNLAGDNRLHLILHVNDIHSTADGVAGAACGNAGRHSDTEIVHIVFSLLGEAAADGEFARGLRFGNIGETIRAVDDCAYRKAYTHRRGTYVKGTGNQSRCGIVSCQNLSAAGHLNLGIVTQLADVRSHPIAIEQHGESACKCECAAAAGPDNGAADGLGIIVDGGQEVQQVDGIDELIAVHVDGHAILATAILFQVHNTLLNVRFLFRGQVRSVSNQQRLIQGKGIVRIGYLVLDRVNLEISAALHRLGTIRNTGGNLVLSIDQRKGCANTNRSTLASADTTGTDCQLRLIGSGDLNIAKAVQNAAIPSLGYCLSLRSENRERAADGSAAAAAGNAASQSLSAQGSSVNIVHVCGMDGDNNNVSNVFILGFPRTLGNDGAGICGNGLVIIDGDGHTSRDCKTGAGQCHGCRIGTGAEIRPVLGVKLHIQSRQAAANQCLGLMLGDVDAHGGRHLRTLALPLGRRRLVRTGRNVAIGLIGSRGNAGLSQTAGILDCSGGARLRSGILVQVIITVGNVFSTGNTISETIQIALHIRTHRRSGAKGIVAIVGLGEHPCLTGSVYGTLKRGSNIGIGIVDSRAGANRSLTAHREGTARSQSMPLLLRVHVDGNQILGVQSSLLDSCLLFLLAEVIGQGVGERLFIKAADIQVTLKSGDFGALRNIGIDLVIDHANGNRRIQRDVHRIFGGFTNRCLVGQRIHTGCCSSLKIILQQRLHAQGTDIHNTILTNVSSSLRFFIAVYIIERKACANTNAGTLCCGCGRRCGSGSGGCCQRRRLRHNNLHRNLRICFNAILIDFRHDEIVGLGCGNGSVSCISSGIAVRRGSRRSGFHHGFDLNLLRNITGRGIGQQNIVKIVSDSRAARIRCRLVRGGCNRNRNLGPRLYGFVVNNVYRVIASLTGGSCGSGRLLNCKGSAFNGIGGYSGSGGACTAASCSGGGTCLGRSRALDLQLGIQNLGKGHGDIDLGAGSRGASTGGGNRLIDSELVLTVGERNHNGRGRRSIRSRCDGIRHLRDFEASIGGNNQSVGGLIARVSGNGHIVHNAIRRLRNGENATVKGLGRRSGAGTRSIGLGGSHHVCIRFSSGIHSGSSDGILVLLILRPNNQTVYCGNWAGFARHGGSRVFNISFSFSVYNRDGQAAGNSHIGRACAGNRMSLEGVGGVFLRRHDLCVCPAGKCGQNRIGSRLAGSSQSIDDRSGDILPQPRGKEGLQLGDIHKIAEHLTCEAFQGNSTQVLHILKLSFLVR